MLYNEQKIRKDINWLISQIKCLKERNCDCQGEVTIDQDNIDIFRYYSLGGRLSGDVVSVINNGQPFVVNEKQSLWIETISYVPNPNDSFSNIYATSIYKLIDLGKGTYGLGGDMVVDYNNLKLITETQSTSEDIENLESTQIIDLGWDITGTNISDYVNDLTTPITFQDQEDGYVLIKVINNGIEESYLFLGIGGTYGQGQLQTLIEDYQLIPGQTSVGLQVGDNISLLNNDVGYITTIPNLYNVTQQGSVTTDWIHVSESLTDSNVRADLTPYGIEVVDNNLGKKSNFQKDYFDFIDITNQSKTTVKANDSLEALANIVLELPATSGTIALVSDIPTGGGDLQTTLDNGSTATLTDADGKITNISLGDINNGTELKVTSIEDGVTKTQNLYIGATSSGLTSQIIDSNNSTHLAGGFFFDSETSSPVIGYSTVSGMGGNIDYPINKVNTGDTTYLPISVNGVKADSAGNIEIASTSGVTSVINVENYRNTSKDESIWLQELIDNSREGSTFIFESDKVYELNNSLIPKLNQTFVGNGATLKRANESKTTLSVDLLSSSNVLSVASIPNDWKIGDKIHVYTGNAFDQTSLYNEITGISDNKVTLSSAIGGYTPATETEITYSIGSGVRKVFDLFSGVQYPVAIPYKIKDFIFDGNYLNNTANYYWFFNACIGNYGYGGEVTGCFFKDIPNENIVCSGILVSDNFAQDINGSFVHFSSPPITLGENIQGTIVRDNRAFRTNKTNPALTDHSFSVLENSWNPGKIIVTGNYFEGVNNGSFCNNFIFPDFGTTLLTNEVSITGNIFKNYTKICQPLTHELLDPYNQKSRLITNNIFIDCGTNDFNLLKTTSIRFHNNLYEGNTTVTNNNQVLKERLSVEGVIVDSPNEPFSVQIGGLNQDNNILLGTAEGKATIQGYNKLTQSFDTNLHAQPYGGNFVIGSLFGNGSKFYVNGTGYFEASLEVNGNVKANNFITNNATASNHALPLGQAQTLLDLKADIANVVPYSGATQSLLMNNFSISEVGNIYTSGGYGSADLWYQAFEKKVNAISVTGDSNKTITLTREDGTILTATFLDKDTEYPDDVINTLTFNVNNDGVLIAITSEGEVISVSLDGRYSLLGHTHTIGNINGLQAALNLKANDTDVLHKTGTETKDGLLNFTDFNGVYLDNKFLIRYRSDFDGLAIGNEDVTSFNVFIKKSNGFVGIGKNDPTEQLEVVGNGKFSGTVQMANATAPNHAAALGQVQTLLDLKANDADVVHKTGNIAEIITGNKTFSGNVTSDGGVFTSQNSVTDNRISFQSGGTISNIQGSNFGDTAGKAITINRYGGYVGVNVDMPTEQLEVGGNAKANNFITNNAVALNHAVALGQVQTEIAIVSDLTVALVVPNLSKYYALTGTDAVASLPPIAGNVGKTLTVVNKSGTIQNIYSNDSVSLDIFDSGDLIATRNIGAGVVLTLFNDGVHWVVKSDY